MENFLEQEKVRAVIYHLLASCYRMPEDKRINESSLIQLRTLLLEHHPEAAAHVEKMITEIETTKLSEEIRGDYLALFVGPKALLAPPYGSLYLENKHQIMGDSTREAMKFYEAAGLKKTDEMNEPDDHICIELEFVYYLISRVVESCEAENYEAAEEFGKLQQEFLKRHVGNWVRPFTQNVNRQAKTHFYKHLGLATELFVRKEATEDSHQMMLELKELAALN
ncbi:TorD/DmsD family molecular chaperone [Tindallia californiensis]|uniref:Chaperone TorD involved in molybdoenzyme TorA maturation n=1 Tax=Tindallia californiensis TaxID=159292 RepID=A0A1H3QTK9_9FIRM|nr:molecular chaperone TorD family protein [Tindallia californiensis]SDZ16391.1 chaperone TorD involved in molybdoenzyme TorA maturation [Tindallia californiensis]